MLERCFSHLIFLFPSPSVCLLCWLVSRMFYKVAQRNTSHVLDFFTTGPFSLQQESCVWRKTNRVPNDIATTRCTYKLTWNYSIRTTLEVASQQASACLQEGALLCAFCTVCAILVDRRGRVRSDVHKFFNWWRMT